MRFSAMSFTDVAAAIEAAGLVPRGGFHPAPEDQVPDLPDGRPAGTVVLAGDVGGRMWPAFAAARHGGDHPLDAWTRTVLDRVAAATGATAVYPFGGPPYHPFQRWAQRAEPVTPSPIGILIHPVWGLWHAYRGALLYAEAFPPPPRVAAPSPCASCRDRPCLSTCPVGAFTGASYDVARCVAHVRSDRGGACRDTGCLARRACPIGRDHGHGPAQAAFHMAAFVRAHPDAP
ncbi:MAG: hypothetical protein ACREER_02830 [Alphaproteobacteria bacterium]